jgi:hypothetical protein
MRRPCTWRQLLVMAALYACHREAPAPVAEVRPADAAAPVDPVVAERNAVLAKVSAVLACFEKQMHESRRRDPRFAGYGRSSYTDVFVFDRTFGARGAIDGPAPALCESILKDYKALFTATAAKVAAREAGRAHAAKPSAIDGEPEFLRAAGGRTGLHMLLHGELTEATFVEAYGSRARAVSSTVRFGAMATDVYRWSDLRFHGQTNPFEPGQREGEIGTSQVSFVGGMAAVLGHFNEELRDGSYDHAALYLGAACHAVQDLAFHHGMTRRQLAGLLFSGERDAAAVESAAARAEAKRLTREVLSIAEAVIGDKRLWERFLAWTPPANYSFDFAAAAIFHDDPGAGRLNLVLLTHFWLDQLGFRRSPALRAELGDGPEGLIRWDLAPVLDRVRVSLENGGISLHGARSARPLAGK